MRREVFSAFASIVILTVLFGLGYPLAVTGIGQALFHGEANGSLIRVHGAVVGSSLIGQQFYEPVLGKNGKPETVKGVPVTQPDRRYFQTRPSATAPADNAAWTAFSNLGPNAIATKAALEANIATYLGLEKPYDPSLTVAGIPVDGLDSSASGVDPDISVANARIQAYRIAVVRHLTLTAVDRLVQRHTTDRSLGFFGEPAVNVLELNIALDRLKGES